MRTTGAAAAAEQLASQPINAHAEAATPRAKRAVGCLPRITPLLFSAGLSRKFSGGEGSLSHHPARATRTALALLAIACCALLLSACGSSSPGNAKSLLRQTFSGAHKVNSGQLSFTLSVNPSGSSTLTKPISLALSGPFQSLGARKVPKSDFTVSISAQGHTGQLSILSTGTAGFVTMSGTSYQLPASTFQRLESSFSSIASTGAGSSSTKSGVLGRLGINPLDWLSDPRVVGTGTVGGAQTTHVRATVNVPALLRDLSTFLQKASSLGISGTSGLSSGLSAATQQRVAGEIHSPSFDLWTGTGDKTVRKLVVGLSVPVKGQISTLAGGLKAAGISLTLQYSGLNQPQTITAPTQVQPYSVFSAKLATVLRAVENGVSSGALGTSSGTGSTGTSTGTGSGGTSSGSSGAAGATTAYSQCIQKAGQDVAKMQQCASKLNSSTGG